MDQITITIPLHPVLLEAQALAFSAMAQGLRAIAAPPAEEPVTPPPTVADETVADETVADETVADETVADTPPPPVADEITVIATPTKWTLIDAHETVADTPPPPVADEPVERPEIDKDNCPWDERIHSGNKKKTAKDVWQRRRNIDNEHFRNVSDEIRHVDNSLDGPDEDVATPTPPPPTDDAATPTPPPPTDATVPTNFTEFLKIVSPLVAACKTSWPEINGWFFDDHGNDNAASMSTDQQHLEPFYNKRIKPLLAAQ